MCAEPRRRNATYPLRPGLLVLSAALLTAGCGEGSAPRFLSDSDPGYRLLEELQQLSGECESAHLDVLDDEIDGLVSGHEERIESICSEQADGPPRQPWRPGEPLEIAFWKRNRSLWCEQNRSLGEQLRRQASAGMRTTRCEGLGYWYFRLFAWELDSMIQSSQTEHPAIGTLTTGSVNAYAVRIPESERFLIVFNSGLLTLATEVVRFVVNLLDVGEQAESIGLTWDPDVIRRRAAADPGLCRFQRLISDTARGEGDFTVASQPRLENPAKMKIWRDLSRGIVAFLVAHEYAHVLLSHTADVTLEVIPRSGRAFSALARSVAEELEADHLALTSQLFLHGGPERDPFGELMTVTAVDVFLTLAGLIELEHGRPPVTHPPASERRSAVRRWLRDNLDSAAGVEHDFGWTFHEAATLAWSQAREICAAEGATITNRPVLRPVESQTGLVRFHLPRTWAEADKRVETSIRRLFWDPYERPGTLYLDVVVLEDRDESSANPAVDALRATELPYPVSLLANGNALLQYSETTEDGGYDFRVHHWLVMGHLPPNELRLASLQYWFPVGEAESQYIQATLETLNREIPRLEFPEGG